MKTYLFDPPDREMFRNQIEQVLAVQGVLRDPTRDAVYSAFYNHYLPFVHKFLAGERGAAARAEVARFLKCGMASGASMMTAPVELWVEALTELSYQSHATPFEDLPDVVFQRFSEMNNRWVLMPIKAESPRLN